MDQSKFEQSRVGIIFGDDFENGQTFIRVQVYLSEQKSTEQYEQLKQLVDENIDIDYSLVIQQRFLPNQKNELIEAVTRIKDRPRFEEFTVKIHSDEEFVYFSFRLPEDKESELQGTIQVLLDAGLTDLATQQNNYLTLDLDTNYDFQQICDDMAKGERFGSSILKQVKLELNVYLEKTFHKQLESTVKNIDEDMLESPQVAFINYFKSLDVDLRFHSTAELPQIIKNQVIFGEDFQMSKEESELPLAKTKQIKRIIDASANDGTAYVTILGLGCFKMDYKCPNLSTLLILYGKVLAKMFGLSQFVPQNL